MAHLGEGLGHADRQGGLRGHCSGPMAPLQRKSVEPMAAHLAPSATRSRHQSLHHFVADSAWSDEQMLLRKAGIRWSARQPLPRALNAPTGGLSSGQRCDVLMTSRIFCASKAAMQRPLASQAATRHEQSGSKTMLGKRSRLPAHGGDMGTTHDIGAAGARRSAVRAPFRSCLTGECLHLRKRC